MITLCVMTDGRDDYLSQTIASYEAMVTGAVTRKMIHDDTGSEEHLFWLMDRYPGYEIRGDGSKLGHGGAVQRAWRHLDSPWALNGGVRDPNRFTFHLEDDYLFNRPVDLDELAEFLDQKWWLAQIALRRERWGREREGFVEDSPSAYVERHDEERTWLEHKLYYTLTPHLYRSRLRQVGWPDGPGGEIYFKDQLLLGGLPWNVPGDHVRFAFWGGRVDGANAVRHIGEVRTGHGY